MVVLVFITSCQVSEKPSRGPVQAQTIRTATAATNTHAWPRTLAARVVNRVKTSERSFPVKSAIISVPPLS